MSLSSCKNATVLQDGKNAKCAPVLNDNLTSILLVGPAVLPVLPLAKFNFDILVLWKDLPVLHSIAFSDASRCGIKKDSVDWDLRFGSLIPEGTSGRT